MTTKTRSIEVVDRKTREVVHRVSVEGKSEKTIGRVVAGMTINMDPRYFARLSTKAVKP